MATHSSILAWRIPWTEEPDGLQSLDCKESEMAEPLPHTFAVCSGDQMVKSLPAVKETQVRSLGQEDPPEKETATPSTIPAWSIPWTEEPGRLQSMGWQSQT